MNHTRQHINKWESLIQSETRHWSLLNLKLTPLPLQKIEFPGHKVSFHFLFKFSLRFQPYWLWNDPWRQWEITVEPRCKTKHFGTRKLWVNRSSVDVYLKSKLYFWMRIGYEGAYTQYATIYCLFLDFIPPFSCKLNNIFE